MQYIARGDVRNAYAPTLKALHGHGHANAHRQQRNHSNKHQRKPQRSRTRTHTRTDAHAGRQARRNTAPHACDPSTHTRRRAHARSRRRTSAFILRQLLTWVLGVLTWVTRSTHMGHSEYSHRAGRTGAFLLRQVPGELLEERLRAFEHGRRRRRCGSARKNARRRVREVSGQSRRSTAHVPLRAASLRRDVAFRTVLGCGRDREGDVRDLDFAIAVRQLAPERGEAPSSSVSSPLPRIARSRLAPFPLRRAPT